MKKVLLVLAIVITALTFKANAQSNSPLPKGFYELQGYQSYGIDTSGLSGEMYITDGAVVFMGECVSTKKYNVYFIGEFEGAKYEAVGDLLDIEGLGFWGPNNDIREEGVYVTFNKEATAVVLSTPAGQETFTIKK